MNNPLNASPWKERWDKASVVLATVFYFSSIPPKIAAIVKGTEWGKNKFKETSTGAGLSGSVAGLLTYLLLPKWIAVSFISIVVATLIAVFISDRAEKVLGVHDDSRIVIDEWIGCWIALVGFPPLDALPHRFGFEVLSAFILFRVFDVYKGPWGNKLQRLPGGWGVVMDDVAAGFIANFFARFVIMILGVF